jgi:hypothetical protein
MGMGFLGYGDEIVDLVEEEVTRGCRRGSGGVETDADGDPGSEVLVVECALTGDSEHKAGYKFRS